MLKPILRDIRKSRAAKQLILEGKIEGKIEGLLEGIIEGKRAGKIETAHIMYKKGIPKSQIMEFTGLKKGDLKDLE
jgi:predicted transposase/invertase (TIGR01784 family)